MTARVGVAGLMIAFLVVVAPAAAAPLKACRDDRGARCGTITVPVHRSDPGGPKLKVRFRVYRHRDRSRPALELRGGGFTDVSAGYYSYGPVRLRLRGVRFVADLAGSGVAVWDRRKQRYRARLRVSGKRSGVLRVAWPSRPNATARIRGRLGGRAVRLRTPAP